MILKKIVNGKIEKWIILWALAIMLAAFFWSLDGTFLRPKFYTLPVELVVFLEHALWLIVFLPWLIKKRKNLKALTVKDRLAVLRVSIFGGLLWTIFITKAFFLAFAGAVSLATVIILQKLQPVFALILARIFLKEKLKPRFYLRAIIAIGAGYILAFGKDGLALGNINRLNNAAFFSFLAAFAFGSSTVFGKGIVNHLDFKLTAWLRFLCTTFLAFILVLITGNLHVITSLSGLQRGLLGVIVCTSGAMAMFLYYFGLQRVSASAATILELFRPVSAIILDFVINKNVLTPLQIWATIVLLLAFFLIIRSQKKWIATFSAPVVAGRGEGKKLWFCTANLDVSTLSIPYGVYTVDVVWENNTYTWLLHYGERPTFDKGCSAEVYIYNFTWDLYSQTLKIIVHAKIREVMKFASPQALQQQIEKDLQALKI